MSGSSGSRRSERIAREIQKDLGNFLLRDLKDPRLTLTSITRVVVSRDLRQAKVYVSAYGDEGAGQETLRALQKASGRVRREIGHRLRLRHTPEILFVLDRSIAEGSRVLELLKKIEKDKGENE